MLIICKMTHDDPEKILRVWMILRKWKLLNVTKSKHI